MAPRRRRIEKRKIATRIGEREIKHIVGEISEIYWGPDLKTIRAMVEEVRAKNNGISADALERKSFERVQEFVCERMAEQKKALNKKV
jgi:hypothetical protein